MFFSVKRIRKGSPDPKKNIRLNRAEFGHSFKSKKLKYNNFINSYYPDSTNLIKKISKFHKLPFTFVNVGLGAESLIKDIYIWHSKRFKQKRVGFGLPNYFMYTISAKIYGYKTFNFNIDPTNVSNLTVDYIKRFVSNNKLSLLVIVNPSHPFEKNWQPSQLKKIIGFCKRKKTIVLLDEVYQGLGSKSVDHLTTKYSNLIILRSFSKAFGLPGLRVGYSLASDKLSKEIETFRLAIELPQHSIEEALINLKKYNRIIKNKCKKIINARKFAHKKFQSKGLKSYNFYGNSITVDLINKVNAYKIGKYLEKNKVYINYRYPNHFGKFINLTTTHIANLKIFFQKFNQAAKKIKI